MWLYLRIEGSRVLVVDEGRWFMVCGCDGGLKVCGLWLYLRVQGLWYVVEDLGFMVCDCS